MTEEVYSIPIVAGDFGLILNLTIRDRTKAVAGMTLDPFNPETWRPIDLTRINHIYVVVQHQDGLVAPALLEGVKSTPYTSGIARLSWAADFFQTPGKYSADLSIEDDNGAIETIYRRLQFVVRPRMEIPV